MEDLQAVTSQAELLKQGRVLRFYSILFYSVSRCINNTHQWFTENGEKKRTNPPDVFT